MYNKMTRALSYTYQKLEEEDADDETIKSISPRREITMKWRVSIFLGLIGLSMFVSGFVTDSWGQANGDVSLLTSFGLNLTAIATETSIENRVKRSSNNVTAEKIPPNRKWVRNVSNHTSGYLKKARLLTSEMEKLMESGKDDTILSKFRSLISSGRGSSKHSENKSDIISAKGSDLTQDVSQKPMKDNSSMSAKNNMVSHPLSSDTSLIRKVKPLYIFGDKAYDKDQNYNSTLGLAKDDNLATQRHHTVTSYKEDPDFQDVIYTVKAGIWRLCIDSTVSGLPRHNCTDHPRSVDGLTTFKVIISTSFLALIVGFFAGICCGIFDNKKATTVSNSFVIIFSIICFVCGILCERHIQRLDSHLTVGWSVVIYTTGCLFLLFSGVLQAASRTRAEVPVKKYEIL